MFKRFVRWPGTELKWSVDDELGELMIDHTGINVSDLEKSEAFYRVALSPLGYEARKEEVGIVIFGSKARAVGEDPAGDFYIAVGEPLTPRSHIAFRAANRSQVDAFYTSALAAHGGDNGAPGLRPEYHEHYYAAFVLDPMDTTWKPFATWNRVRPGTCCG